MSEIKAFDGWAYPTLLQEDLDTTGVLFTTEPEDGVGERPYRLIENTEENLEAILERRDAPGTALGSNVDAWHGGFIHALRVLGLTGGTE